MIGFPNAKINLGLKILNKREDGYHNIHSIFAPITLTDILEFLPAKQTSFKSHGIEIPESRSGNLITQAYDLIAQDYDVEPLEIRLEKIIPIGAGLGGGSADGSFMLNMMNDYFELNISTQKLQDYASKLGADCPFFIENKPALVEGIGDRMEVINLDLKQYHLALINPGIHISTKEAYSNLNILDSQNFDLEKIINSSPDKWTELGLNNDFERSVFTLYPEIKDIKERLLKAGALYVSMTGTGSTVYGIFKEAPSGVKTNTQETLFNCKFG